MRKKILAAILMVCIAMPSIGIAPAFANDPVKVYLDNELLTFNEAQPQIVNDYTMVPVRETAVLLGFEFDYNENTAEYIMSKEGLEVEHELNSDIIYVNGVGTNFPAASMVINDRSVMPVRMLEAAIGAKIDWHEDTRSVYIDTTSSATPTPTVPGNIRPTILSSYYETINAVVGEEYSIVVLANDDTESVRLLDFQENVIDTSNNYEEVGEGRRFHLALTPAAESLVSIRYTIEAGDDYGNYYADYGTSVSFKFDKGATIESIEISVEKATKGAKGTVVAIASADTTRIKIETEDGSQLANTSTYDTQSDGTRKFTLDFILQSDGNADYRVFPGTASSYSNQYKTVSVTAAAIKTLEIEKLELASSNLSRGDNFTVTLTTTNAAEYVRIIDKDNSEVVTASYNYKESGTSRIWELKGYPRVEGVLTYVVHVYDEDEKEVTREFSVAIGTAHWNSSGSTSTELRVINFDYTPKKISNYETVTLTFTTTDNVKRIEINDQYGNELIGSDYYQESETGRYKWELKMSVSSSGTFYYYVYGNDGRTVSDNFEIEWD